MPCLQAGKLAEQGMELGLLSGVSVFHPTKAGDRLVAPLPATVLGLQPSPKCVLFLTGLLCCFVTELLEGVVQLLSHVCTHTPLLAP